MLQFKLTSQTTWLSAKQVTRNRQEVSEKQQQQRKSLLMYRDKKGSAN